MGMTTLILRLIFLFSHLSFDSEMEMAYKISPKLAFDKPEANGKKPKNTQKNWIVIHFGNGIKRKSMRERIKIWQKKNDEDRTSFKFVLNVYF